MEELKLSSYADMILYINNPKDTTQKLLELINKFIKVAGYKGNIQRSKTNYNPAACGTKTTFTERKTK